MGRADEERVSGNIIPNPIQEKAGLVDKRALLESVAAAFENEVESWPEFHASAERAEQLARRRMAR